MKRISIEENGLYVVYEINEEGELKLLHFAAIPLMEEDLRSPEGTAAFYPVEIQLSGLNRPLEIHGLKYAESTPSFRLKYISHRDFRNELGRKLEWTLADAPTGLTAICHLQFFDGIKAARSWTEVINSGAEEMGLEMVSSFVLSGIEKEGNQLPEEKMEILLGHNAWMKELLFSRHSLLDFGLASTQRTMPRRSSQMLSISNTGSWSAKEHLPLAAIRNREADHTLFFQIEHNGSWHFEISDARDHLYLLLCGPDELHGHWWKCLSPGDRFVSVPVGIAASPGGLEEAAAEMTKYRRAIRRENADNRRLPVIFNDYMNCLFGDPTAEKEYPMIDKAAKAGCEYYVIDAGWYSDGSWWDSVGEWLPSRARFPEGLYAVLSYIRKKGMVPGLWLEIEVMGIHCPKAARVPDDWFFIRHGKRTAYRSRYQLDFRNEDVVAHAAGVIRRLVRDMGVGYIKMDYNIEAGIGTERNADSCGDGLLEHNRAYLAFIDSLFAEFPDLVIENCSSGGMRMDYAMLSRHSLQSTSDLEDYRLYSTIAANAPVALAPEQAAVWSYPIKSGDEEETVFNMVNAMLLRIHQSGHLVDLSPSRFELVREGIRFYKEIREDLRDSLPFWPLGLSSPDDPFAALGLHTKHGDLIALWRRNTEADTVDLPLCHLAGKAAGAECVYPRSMGCALSLDEKSGTLRATLPHPYTARMIRVVY